MLFDESARKILLKAYQALPEEERAVYRAMSVLFIPAGVTALTPVLNAAMNALGFNRKWKSSQYTELMEKWQRVNLVEKCTESYTQGWGCSTLMTEPAVREAIDRGEFGAVEAAAGQMMDLASEERSNYFSNVTRYLRALRKAVYLGDVSGFERLTSASVNRGYSRYADLRFMNPLLLILANPLDLERISSLPPRISGSVFDPVLRESLGNPALFNEIYAALEAYRKQNMDYHVLTAVWAEFAMLTGLTENAEVERALAKTGYAEKYSVAALGALMNGERDRALEFYEEGLAAMRKTTKKRKVAYSSWAGIFYPLLLLASGGTVKKIENYLDAAEAGFAGYMSAIPSKMTRFLLPGKAKYANFFQNGAVMVDKPERYADAFFFLLCVYWLDVNKAREFHHLAEKAYNALKELRFGLPAAELAALMRELWPNAADKLLPSPQYPLKDILSRQSDWERSLSALSGISGNAAAAKGSKRFIWEISWRSGEKRCDRVELTPVEQSLQANGWSKGKNVALRRLHRSANTIPSMTDQDHRAASAVREDRSYYGVEYYIAVDQALEALAGHPLIFRAQDGGRVDIVADEPQLTVAENGESYHLKLLPFPPYDAAQQHIVSEDGPNRLRIVRFEERHVKIAEILGESGISIPGRAKDALLKALGSLASVVTIHSDLDGVESNARRTEADPRIYVQLQPLESDGGPYGLEAAMIVRPLGPNGVPCRPGVGGVSIFGLADGSRLQARRDLDGEKDALARAMRACPAIMDAEQTANERWRLSTPETALEFLMQVQEMGDAVVAEWPKGQTMRVRSQVSMSSMNVAARGSQDWFAISGTLSVDENLVLSMKDLMELLKAGHGRFLPLGDGQFLALTKEFRRKLDAMAALGDAKGGDLRVSSLAVGLLEPLLSEAGSFESGADWKRRAALVTEAADMTAALPSTFKGELRNYQAEGYRWLARLAHWGAGACLADDMGLGKTIQALALLVARGSGGAALVVAPTSVCSNWVAEAARFAPTLNIKELRYSDREKTLGDLSPFDVVVTTYGLLQNEIERLSAIQWHTIVLDEAQAIKNMGTKRSAAAMKLSGDFRMATTGTPIENHLSELWNLFRFLNPHFLGSFDSFNRRFAVPIERDGDAEARARLKKVIQPFILRRNKQQVLEELPSKTEITLRVDLKEEEQAFYEALRRDSVERLSTKDGAADQRFKIFAELMRLRRACCNAVLAMPEEEQGRNFPSAKLEAFAEILEDLRENGHKALVFSQFVDHLTIIRRYLDDGKVPYQYLDGSTPPQERTRRVAAFQAGEGECFLISLKAGGTGLNLTAADYVIHMDPWWNPAVEEQASDRAHRIGQSRPVTVYRIVAKDTIEEKIVDLHTWKRDLAESLLDESETPLRLSAEEMLELIKAGA